METLYGESLEIQTGDSYGSNGGIALFSTGDETITGGSDNEGSSVTSSRFYWSITRSGEEPNYTYSGGITGSDTFNFGFKEPTSPFYGFDYSAVWQAASTPPGTLDSFFQPWNSTASELTKHDFIGLVLNRCPEGCYRSYSA